MLRDITREIAFLGCCNFKFPTDEKALCRPTAPTTISPWARRTDSIPVQVHDEQRKKDVENSLQQVKIGHSRLCFAISASNGLMLNKPSMQHIEVDGQPMLIASMLRKGTAVAIDLGLIVAFASMCFGVISWFIPLDDAKAKLPISTVVFAATFYVVVGRNRWYSAGRRILRLRLVPLPGRAASFFNKAISVHIDPKPPEDNSALAFALCLIGISTGMALLSLAAALATTHIFKPFKNMPRPNRLHCCETDWALTYPRYPVPF